MEKESFTGLLIYSCGHTQPVVAGSLSATLFPSYLDDGEHLLQVSRGSSEFQTGNIFS